jgi:aarF domain-containing kinase
MIVRNNKRTQKPEIVLLDHGLYIQSSEKFRETYCRFWVGLFTLDMDLLNEIGKEWGIPDISVFATVTLAKPWKEDISPHINNKTFLTDAFKMQEKSKDNLIEFLKNMEKMPQELIFVGRNLNIVRANNKALGKLSFVRRSRNLLLIYSITIIASDNQVFQE